MASFLSTTSIASLTFFWRPQQGSRIDIGERGDSDWPVSGEDRQNSVTLETAEHHQPLLNDLVAVSPVSDWEKENVKKAQCWENMKKGEAVASLARLSMKASANWDVSAGDIAERKDRDLMFFDRRFIGPKQTSGLHSAS